jgi:hypothetical protein
VDYSNVPVDPTAVTAKVKKPDGTVVDITSTVIKQSTGVYRADYLPVDVGIYEYEFIGTGSVQVPGVKTFEVRSEAF